MAPSAKGADSYLSVSDILGESVTDLDADAVDFLRGTEIDYAREGINRTLRFRNPNVVAECGCGESFSVN